MSLSVQFLSLLAMIGTGIVAAAFMDMIGIGIGQARRKSFIGKNSIYFEIIGWTVVGCTAFLVLFAVRDGAWRIYDPFAQMSGMLLYISIFHKFFRFVGRIVFIVFVRPVWLVIYFIVSIIRQMIGLLVNAFHFFTKPFLKLFRKYYRKDFKSRAK